MLSTWEAPCAQICGRSDGFVALFGACVGFEKGFQPIRPFIVTKVSVTCPPHMALELTASADGSAKAEVESCKEEVKNE